MKTSRWELLTHLSSRFTRVERMKNLRENVEGVVAMLL